MKYIKSFEAHDVKALNLDLLYYARKIASLNKMRELISQGADVNYQDGNRTPLMLTAINGFYSGAKLLIDNGANVNATCKQTNYTAFDFAISQGTYNFIKNKNYKKLIDLLINSGADLNAGVDVLANDKCDVVEKYIKDKFPEQFRIYLLKKQATKYNI